MRNGWRGSAQDKYTRWHACRCRTRRGFWWLRSWFVHHWWSARGDELSSDIVARNRSPPAIVVRGEEDKDITMRIIRCTCPVKPCWVRCGGRSSICEDRVTSCGREGERTSRLSIDPPWFTPLIIWVSLSLTPGFLNPLPSTTTIISPGRSPPENPHLVSLDRAKAQGWFLRAHHWHPTMQT
jgi:hypothetical protein